MKSCHPVHSGYVGLLSLVALPYPHCPLLLTVPGGPQSLHLGHTRPTASEVPQDFCQDNKPGLLSSSLNPSDRLPCHSQEGPFCVAGQGEQTWTSLWVANLQLPCHLPLMIPSRALWGSWARLSVPTISLVIGSSLHSASGPSWVPMDRFQAVTN